MGLILKNQFSRKLQTTTKDCKLKTSDCLHIDVSVLENKE